ncbi:MAG TPA: hypothetical protein VFE61_33195, partial [Candidatus Sulfotelmatobacter sp.]|nr:hypothetical protein [Candidatus Sulfotelmatobacter sp.]
WESVTTLISAKRSRETVRTVVTNTHIQKQPTEYQLYSITQKIIPGNMAIGGEQPHGPSPGISTHPLLWFV